MSTFDLRQSLGDLAALHPDATTVLLRYRLDFCCGGGRRFDEACRRLGLEPESVALEIQRELSEPGSEGVDWRTRPVEQLVPHIVERYHEPLRLELPPIIGAAAKVERVHNQKASCPHGLAEHLATMQSDLLEHMMKEERVLFPAILSGARGKRVHMPVRVMTQEHDDHGRSLARLRALAHDFDPPEEACATWRALYRSLAKLEAELMAHIHLENSVLFPRVLTDEA